MGKKHPDKVASVKWDLTLIRILLKNQNLFIWKKILPPKRDFTFINPGSHFGGTLFPHINISFRISGKFLCLKSICNTFKDSRKTLEEKHNKTEVKLLTCWQIFSNKWFIKIKMVNALTQVENNMGPEKEVFSCSRDKEKKRVLDGMLLWSITSQLTNHKWLLWDKILKLVSQEWMLSWESW